MKKIRLLTVLLIALCVHANAQSPKYVLIEHFTQNGCDVCLPADTNFKKYILTPYNKFLREIIFHTPGPDVDTMYSVNERDIDARIAYYSLQNIPWGILNGNRKNAHLATFTQADITDVWSETSPVKINVSQSDSADYRKVTVTVTTTGTVPTDSFRLLGAVIEKEITFPTPTGTNNQKVFYNVFRRWLDTAAANLNGVYFPIPAKGSSASRSYKFLKNPAWKADQIEVVAILQNKKTKAVLNTGSTFDKPLNLSFILPPKNSKAGSPNNLTKFDLSLTNTGANSETFIFTLRGVSAPKGWIANVSVDGADGDTINGASTRTFQATLGASNGQKSVSVNITPNATPAIAAYVLSVKSKTNPDAPEYSVVFYIISNVEDLIVSSASRFGDAGMPGNATAFTKIYTDALTAAGSKTFAATNHNFYIKATRDSILANVQNVYFNAGWTFPVMSDDNLIDALTRHLNAPKHNLYISGQDLGWETWGDAPAPATPASQIFYTNFLNANWFNDGSPITTDVFPESSDAIFGKINNSVIDTNVYGAGFTYPDQIDVLGVGKAFLKYGADSLKKAGVRAEVKDKYKTVYMSVGLEQIKDAAVRNAILKNTYDWFHGAISSTGFDIAMAKLSLGQNYPNPSKELTHIPLSNVDKDAWLEVSDITGRILLQQKIAKGSTSTIVNTSTLEAGIYLYRLIDGSNVTTAKRMQVIR